MRSKIQKHSEATIMAWGTHCRHGVCRAIGSRLMTVGRMDVGCQSFALRPKGDAKTAQCRLFAVFLGTRMSLLATLSYIVHLPCGVNLTVAASHDDESRKMLGRSAKNISFYAVNFIGSLLIIL